MRSGFLRGLSDRRSRWSHILAVLVALEVIGGEGVLHSGPGLPAVLVLAWVGVALPRATRRLPRPRVWIPTVLLLGWSGLSLLWSVSPVESLETWARMLLAAAFGACLWVQPDRRRLFDSLAVGAGGALAALTVTMLLVVREFDGVGVLGHATPVSRNTLAIRLVVAGVLALPMLRRRGWEALLLPAVFALGLTASRSGIAGLAGAGAATWFFGHRHWPSPRALVLLLVGVLALGAAIRVVLEARDIQYRVALHKPGSTRSPLNGRETLWLYGEEMLAERPLHGFGLAAFRSEYERRRPQAIADGRRRMAPSMGPDGVWLDLLSGLGLVGTAAAVVLLLQLVRRLPSLVEPGPSLLFFLLLNTVVASALSGFIHLFALALVAASAGWTAESPDRR